MANDNTLNVEIKAVITNLESNLKKATKGLEKFSEKSVAMGKKMQTSGIAMSKGITAPLAILGGVALKAAADLETLETSLSVMTGSAEKGKAIMKDLADFTAKTPFQLEGVGNTAKQLLAFGFTTEQVKENLQFLGDAAAGSGNDLGSLGQIFGQVSAAGKLTGERLNQLQERAIPIGPALAKSMGVAESSIRGLVSEGKVSFADFEKAFRSLSQEGGVFSGAMIKQSQTIAGVFSTLRDNVQLALGSLGQEIATAFDLKDVTTSLIGYIQKITEWFSTLDKSTKKTIIVIVGLVAAIGPLLTVVGLFATTVLPGLITVMTYFSATVLPAVVTGFNSLTAAMLANPIGLVVAGVAALTLAFTDLLDRMTGLGDRWETFMNIIKSGGNSTRFATLQSVSLAKKLKEQEEATHEASKATRSATIDNLNAAKGEFELAAVTNTTTAAITKKAAALRGVATVVKTLAGEFELIAGTSLTNEGDGILRLLPTSDEMASRLEAWRQHIEGLKVSLIEFKEAASDIIVNGIGNTFSLLGSSIGDALANGTNVLKAAGGALLQGLGSILVQLGEMAIAAGIANLALFAALSGPPNPVSAAIAIAAGVALVAVGSAVSSLNKSVASGGTGGGASSSGASGNSSFSGGSTSGYSSGGSSGGTYVFEIQGSKLVGVLKNTLDRNRSLGGTNLAF